MGLSVCNSWFSAVCLPGVDFTKSLGQVTRPNSIMRIRSGLISSSDELLVLTYRTSRKFLRAPIGLTLCEIDP